MALGHMLVDEIAFSYEFSWCVLFIISKFLERQLELLKLMSGKMSRLERLDQGTCDGLQACLSAAYPHHVLVQSTKD